jgi:hypothetical protein
MPFVGSDGQWLARYAARESTVERSRLTTPAGKQQTVASDVSATVAASALLRVCHAGSTRGSSTRRAAGTAETLTSSVRFARASAEVSAELGGSPRARRVRRARRDGLVLSLDSHGMRKRLETVAAATVQPDRSERVVRSTLRPLRPGNGRITVGRSFEPGGALTSARATAWCARTPAARAQAPWISLAARSIARGRHAGRTSMIAGRRLQCVTARKPSLPGSRKSSWARARRRTPTGLLRPATRACGSPAYLEPCRAVAIGAAGPQLVAQLAGSVVGDLGPCRDCDLVRRDHRDGTMARLTTLPASVLFGNGDAPMRFEPQVSERRKAGALGAPTRAGPGGGGGGGGDGSRWAGVIRARRRRTELGWRRRGR